MNHALATTGAEGVEIFMSVLSATPRLQRSTLGDLTAMWAALFAALAYLDVPLRNAPLLATVLVLQAALGTFVITRLLEGLQPSLLLLCGPGLILGGALSFAVFQIVGRGVVGIFATTGVGLIAAFMVSQRVAGSADPPRMWILTQILGLAALAMVTEFSEMLPIGVAFFILTYVLDPAKPKPLGLRVALVSATACVIVFSFSIRQNYWWLVTDDYQYFEVISRHITQSGPTADWGVLNFFKYHWLSYGWSGLLEQLGGGMAPFVSLTRVMPFVYSASLAASLILISERAHRRMPTFFDSLPVWVVVSLVELDWSGTSTAGVYAALAALAYVFFLLYERPGIQTRGVLLLGAFTIIVALTKLPSVFSIGLLSLGSISISIANRFSGLSTRKAITILGAAASLLITATVVSLSGQYLGWRLDLGRTNPGLGDLSNLGRLSSAIGMVLLRLPLWVLITRSAVSRWTSLGHERHRGLLNPSTILAFLFLGLILELGITMPSPSDFPYFSDPMYFFASLSIIAHGDVQASNSTRSLCNHRVMASAALVAVCGMYWTQWGNQAIWDSAEHFAFDWFDIQLKLPRFVTGDSRVGATLAAVAIATGLRILGRRIAISQLLFLPSILLTFIGNFDSTVRDFNQVVQSDVTSAFLGAEDTQRLAARLRLESDESDLVATNHLYDTSGNTLSDFSLAVWSGREFLVLGPSFGGDIFGRKAEAIESSIQFADSPTNKTCEPLEEAGVKWFVVDLQLTETRDWSVCAEEIFSAGEYTLLSMRYHRIDMP